MDAASRCTRSTRAAKLVASGIVSAKGLVEEAPLAQRFAPGQYEAVFHVAAFYRAVGLTLPKVPFLDVVTYRFGSTTRTRTITCR